MDADATARLDALEKKIDNLTRGLGRLMTHLGAMPGKTAPGAQPAEARVASDEELDAQYGDPEIRRDPKKWDGESHKGDHMSACPPAYLDALASYLDWGAEKDEETAATTSDEAEAAKKRKYAKYGRKDAALARGWARRLRALEV